MRYVKLPHGPNMQVWPSSEDKSEDAEEVRQNIWLLTEACRRGDLEDVTRLVTHRAIPVNQIDQWQCTPLYLACLCGHIRIVEFLLENGAVCDPNTFEGERAIYGALTQDIRNLLIEYNFTKVTDAARPFLKFMSELVEQVDGKFSDIVFRAKHGRDEISMPAHRFIVASRSPIWKEHLASIWYQTETVLLDGNHTMRPQCLQMLMLYMYTGRVRKEEPAIMEELLMQATYLGLTDLKRKLVDYNSTHHKTRRLRILEADSLTTQRLQLDMQVFIETYVLPGIPLGDLENPSCASKVLNACVFSHADLLIRVADIIFPCHRAVLSGRCEYFDTYLNGNFSETIAKEHYVLPQIDKSTTKEIVLPIYTFSNITSPDLYRIILSFLYTDLCDIPPKLLHSILILADLLLLERLRSIASVAITQLGNELPPDIDIFTLTRTAMSLQIDRLEQHCARFFAYRIENYLGSPSSVSISQEQMGGNKINSGGNEEVEKMKKDEEDEEGTDIDPAAEFRAVIIESAQTISERQETDTIPLLDDIRYHLARRFHMVDMKGQFLNNERDQEDSFELIMNEEDRGRTGEPSGWEAEEKKYNALLYRLNEVVESLGLEA